MDLRGRVRDLQTGVQQVVALGDRLADPGVWDGPAAAEFRQGRWRETRASLQPAAQVLERLRSSAEGVIGDILKAGGGGHVATSTPPGPGAGPSGNGGTTQISPHMIINANDPRAARLKAGWDWVVKNYGPPHNGDDEFTRWHQVCSISPYRDACTGQLATELGGMFPNFRIEGSFNQGAKVLLSTAPMGAIAFMGDPGSLIGKSQDVVRQLVPEGWTGPKPLKTGAPGERWFDGKGNSIMIEEGDPSAAGGDAIHKGPYVRISQNGEITRIALDGNPALSDPNAPTMSVTGQDGTVRYVNAKSPIEVPPGEEVGTEGVGGEGGAAPAPAE
jgi:hypothetical protein